MADLNTYFVTLDVYDQDSALIHSHSAVPIHSVYAAVVNWAGYGASKITLTDSSGNEKDITL